MEYDADDEQMLFHPFRLVGCQRCVIFLSWGSHLACNYFNVAQKHLAEQGPYPPVLELIVLKKLT